MSTEMLTGYWNQDWTTGKFNEHDSGTTFYTTGTGLNSKTEEFPLDQNPKGDLFTQKSDLSALCRTTMYWATSPLLVGLRTAGNTAKVCVDLFYAHRGDETKSKESRESAWSHAKDLTKGMGLLAGAALFYYQPHLLGYNVFQPQLFEYNVLKCATYLAASALVLRILSSPKGAQRDIHCVEQWLGGGKPMGARQVERLGCVQRAWAYLNGTANFSHLFNVHREGNIGDKVGDQSRFVAVVEDSKKEQ